MRDWLSWLAIDEPSQQAFALLVAHLVAAVGTSVHILLTKDNPRSAAGWMALAWMSPLAGSLAYAMLGVNRVARKATRLARRMPHPDAPHEGRLLADRLDAGHLQPLRHALDGLTQSPLLGGNDVELLLDGDETFPAMLEAIEGAERTVAMMTFIFDRDPWGRRFVDALAAARARGVEVKLLIDGVGTLFSWPTVLGWLREAGVPYRRFLWSVDPREMALLNLRNHRKILVVDGRVAFTGGMNVRGAFVQETPGPRTADQDLHVRVTGPLVAQLLDLFAADWAFETGESLEGDGWYPPLAEAGWLAGRVIPDGPDGDLDKAAMAFLSAVTCAQRRVAIVTPYFLPEEPLQLALVAAARRGVDVDVIVPASSNQPLVAWAMNADIPPLLEAGVRVWAQAPPFDHTKLLVIDDRWGVVGSANWDPRSLRLNFEVLLEVWGARFAADLSAVFEEKRARSTQLMRGALLDRPVAARLRDGLVRLFKPYL